MGGFNPPVPQQDNNTEIRVAVLLSFLLQMMILMVGPMRKRSSSPVARFAIWSSYLLAEWVADLALGLLLNNMGNIGGGGNSQSSQHASDGSSPMIFVFWTPFLLVHLGGQDCLTALSIQDNDLWLRGLTGFAFQLFSACVIFFSSLQGNPMVPATVLIFVVGIIKYGERIYSLYSGSVDAVFADITKDSDPGPNYAKLMSLRRSNEMAGLPVELVVVNPTRERGRARAGAVMEEELDKNRGVEGQAYKLFCMFRQLCFDVTPSYKERAMSKAYFLGRTDVAGGSPAAAAFEVIELELNFMYDMVHTKEPIAHTKAGCVLRFVCSTCIVSALLVFLCHHKRGITRVDVAITYVLLLGGVALDAAALAMLVVSNWTLVLVEEEAPRLAAALRYLRPPRQRHWREDASQANLISYCLGKPEPPRHGRLSRTWPVVRMLAMVAEKLHIRGTFHDLLFIRREPLTSTSQGLDSYSSQHNILYHFVFDELRGGATMRKKSMFPGEGVLEYLREILAEERETRIHYRAYNRAQGKEEDCVVINDRAEQKLGTLLGKLKGDGFGQSLLMWHIATDLCCYVSDPTVLTSRASDMKDIAQTLSEYMLYLLIKQPEILLASAGIGLKWYRDTCAEAKRFIFQFAAAWNPDHRDVQRMLLHVETTMDPSEVKGDLSKSVLFDAVIAAKVLRDLGEELMWEVVFKVWVEMLVYAAGKCKGSTHVQQLSRGGELITMVWFLMAHMGLSDDVYKTDHDMQEEVELVPRLIVHH